MISKFILFCRVQVFIYYSDYDTGKRIKITSESVQFPRKYLCWHGIRHVLYLWGCSFLFKVLGNTSQNFVIYFQHDKYIIVPFWLAGNINYIKQKNQKNLKNLLIGKRVQSNIWYIGLAAFTAHLRIEQGVIIWPIHLSDVQ